MTGNNAPTVVLVHGAFADGSSFVPVVRELLDDGLQVLVPAVPNRSLLGDAAYIASVVRQVKGPVVLVGHSYGGAVITVAGMEENVKALVFVSAYALEAGESLAELQGGFPDSLLASGLVYTTYPIEGSDQPGTDVSVDPAKFREIFAADVDPDLARVLAVSQRPLAALAFGEKAPAAAWKTKPGWASVSVNDHHQPRRRAVRVPAGGHHAGRARLLAPGHAVAPEGGRRPDSRGGEQPGVSRRPGTMRGPDGRCQNGFSVVASKRGSAEEA